MAVVGATGAVGLEMIKTLEKRKFPVGRLTLLASARSVGKKLKFQGTELPVQELKKDAFGGMDIALFSAGSGISTCWNQPSLLRESAGMGRPPAVR